MKKRTNYSEEMGSLSQDLNSYLSKSNSTTSLSSLTSKLSSMSLPTLNSIKSPFGGGGGEDDEEPFLGVSSDSGLANNRKEERSWIARKMEEHLPSLSKKQRIIGFMTSLILGNNTNFIFLPDKLFSPQVQYVLGLRYLSFPCFLSIQENFPCSSPWEACSPCPASPSCGAHTVTWCTSSARRGYPSH